MGLCGKGGGTAKVQIVTLVVSNLLNLNVASAAEEHETAVDFAA